MEEALTKVGPNESACPSLTYKQRIIGFGITVGVGYLLAILSYLTFFLGDFDIVQFIIFYTLGNVCILTASCFLWGPQKQFKTMMKPTRMVISIVVILLIIGTLVLAFWKPELKLIILILGVLQLLAMFWYNLSYVPFGRKLLKKCCKKCCCDCDEEGGEES